MFVVIFALLTLVFLFLLCLGFKGLCLSKKSFSKLLLTDDIVVGIELLFIAEDTTGQSSHSGFHWNSGDVRNGIILQWVVQLHLEGDCMSVLGFFTFCKTFSRLKDCLMVFRVSGIFIGEILVTFDAVVSEWIHKL